MKKKLISALTVVGILAGGFVISGILSALRAEPPRTERTVQTPLVETMEVLAGSGSLVVSGTGTVRPTTEITLAAQVGGQVVRVSPAFVSGGSFRAGDVLATIEPADYENALAVAQAEVVQRRYDVIRAEEEVAVARDEWARSLADGSQRVPDSTSLGRLAYREPELELARAGLRAAEARVRDAELRLSRTRIVAPFDGMVRAKQVDIGQFLAPGQPVASVYGTAEVEIVVPMSASQMALLDPDWRSNGRAEATVIPQSAPAGTIWPGYVHRIEGALDQATRLTNVVVRVPRPYRPAADRAPLLVGTFVEVQIQGRSVERFWEIPRSALRDSDGVPAIWTVTDSALDVRSVRVVQQVDDRAIITAPDLPESLPLIVSDLAVVSSGMAIRTLSNP